LECSQNRFGYIEIKPRDIFVYFTHEGKVRAPAAAMSLIEKLRS